VKPVRTAAAANIDSLDVAAGADKSIAQAADVRRTHTELVVNPVVDR
jgi:hypothetical protein